ncbi:MAG TPA: MgtC/SapB family protein [Candidatus Dormibacteraeota bacterium]|nr:MgtC/SapB family protein [Candidatus Dormibacteraeota bacterium]
MPGDLIVQLDLSFRLLVAAILGGAIGYEREIHQHPAGIRTHLLVSLGSALFTVLSIAGFAAPANPNGSLPTDPSRVAAQIVTGIGFLGAGAILKYGTTIKGLTTAGSLWATAAIGMAVGAGQWLIAIVATAIALASLWPLHALVQHARRRGGRSLRVRIQMPDLRPFAAVAGELSNRRIEIAAIHTERSNGRYDLELDLRLPPGAVPSDVIQGLSGIQGARLVDARPTTAAEHEDTPPNAEP